MTYMRGCPNGKPICFGDDTAKEGLRPRFSKKIANRRKRPRFNTATVTISPMEVDNSPAENEAKQFFNDLSDDSDMNYFSTHMAHVSPISSEESEDNDDEILL